MNRKVVKKLFLFVDFELASPLCISGTGDEYTDIDVIRNGTGDVFIPGTSMAGAFRQYLGFEKKQNSMFGYADSKNGAISQVYVGDGFFDIQPKVSTRDGIRLKEDDKLVEAGAKYDYQIIETGAKGYFRLELVIREDDDEEKFRTYLKRIFAGVETGRIRFGAKKTRGLGCMKISRVGEFVVTKENVRDGLEKLSELRRDIKQARKLEDKKAIWILNSESENVSQVDIVVPLKQMGSISINTYHAVKGEPDRSHITCDGKPVIPGSSWNGALRSRIREILKTTGRTTEEIEEILRSMFGFVKENTKEAFASTVVIDESIIDKAVMVRTVRNKISRFDATTEDGALFEELTYAGGTTKLSVHVKKKAGDNLYSLYVGLLLLAIKDVQVGLLPVGGLTAVGHGIFQEDGKITLCGNEALTEADFIKTVWTYKNGESA